MIPIRTALLVPDTHDCSIGCRGQSGESTPYLDVWLPQQEEGEFLGCQVNLAQVGNTHRIKLIALNIRFHQGVVFAKP